MTKVAIVILNWNGLKNTRECLSSIERLDKKDISLITFVVDNASTDNSASLLAKEFKEIVIVQNPK